MRTKRKSKKLGECHRQKEKRRVNAFIRRVLRINWYKLSEEKRDREIMGLSFAYLLKANRYPYIKNHRKIGAVLHDIFETAAWADHVIGRNGVSEYIRIQVTQLRKYARKLRAS